MVARGAGDGGAMVGMAVMGCVSAARAALGTNGGGACRPGMVRMGSVSTTAAALASFGGAGGGGAGASGGGAGGGAGAGMWVLLGAVSALLATGRGGHGATCVAPSPGWMMKGWVTSRLGVGSATGRPDGVVDNAAIDCVVARGSPSSDGGARGPGLRKMRGASAGAGTGDDDDAAPGACGMGRPQSMQDVAAARFFVPQFGQNMLLG
jgi:hypothetical protein